MSNQANADAAFNALGDPMRRQLLRALTSGPRAVGELAAAVPIGRPAVSKHLRVLEGAGLVEHQARGTRNLYSLAPDGLVNVQQWLVATWDCVLGSFAKFAVSSEHTDPLTRPPVPSAKSKESGP